MSPLSRRLRQGIEDLKAEKRFRGIPILESEQGPRVRMNGREVIMLSSNNYLGLADHPRLKEAACEGVRRYGCGTASVRFICGTMDVHRELEGKIAQFLGAEDALLYSSCSAANEGLIPALMGEGDLVCSDGLNHASIIDGIRLSRARRHIYPHRDLDALEEGLRANADAGLKMVVTDGVFSMEGDLAPLAEMADLADRYGAFLVVDESHALGVLGANGRGTAEHLGVEDRVQIQTGTLGKSLGGSMGGYVAGSRDLVEYLTQVSRPYIFSNALPPAVLFVALAALDLIREDPSPRDRLLENTASFRREMKSAGFHIIEGFHPIVPVLIGDTPKALEMSAALFEAGVFVTGFGYPVVPKGEARLRAQISAAHTREDLDRCLEAFRRVGKRLGVI
ncbi:MAG: glycine C-acetyltransferase [Candidatus Tectomicrobia bacterium]|nr:glycine C-acetyltransferase [Candidatus Tectomicrobia bacterium]